MKTTSINLRLTNEEKKTLQVLSHQHQMNLSEYLRFKGGLTSNIQKQ